MSRLDQFAADVALSRLVSPDDIQAARARLPRAASKAPDAAQQLARLLIDQGKLTTYQARKLLAGLTRGFFLGPYRILRRLGQGGMGKVYLAVHETTGHRVALKVLPPAKAAEHDQALARFQREIELSQRVHHPNLARTLGHGEDDDVHYMVMEYVPGDSLYHLVRGKNGSTLRVPDAARLFLKILDGLNAAHNAGLVHRDIKPSNIMVTPDGDARVLDLGLARALSDEGGLTHANTVLGTLDYASPEQLSDAAKADRRSDLYSLGCTLYFALSGRPPFPGGDVINKIFKHRMEDPPPLEKITRGVPATFATIVRKLMAKEPADRYQNGAQVQADLARWTDPKLVASILGAEAEAARAFKPPPPILEEDELKIFDEDARPGSSPSVLRDLGDPEPRPAPFPKPIPPQPPRPAVVRPLHPDDPASPLARTARLPLPEGPTFLTKLIAGVCLLVAAIVVLMILFR